MRMQHFPSFVALAAGAMLAACATQTPDPVANASVTATALPGTPAADSASAPIGVLEPGAVAPRSRPIVSIAPSAPSSTAWSAVRVRVVRVAATLGEDGAGKSVPAKHPVALDFITSGSWPATGAATTVWVGGLYFQTLTFPSLSTMRVIVADEGLLPRGAEVALQTGPTPEARRVLAASLPAVTP